MYVVASLVKAAPVRRILTHIGERTEPPPIPPDRSPPLCDDEQVTLPDWESIDQPAPEYLLDQRLLS